MKAYECILALGGILLVVGGVELTESFVLGVACLGAGVALLILADLGRRLIRTERFLTAPTRQPEEGNADILSTEAREKPFFKAAVSPSPFRISADTMTRIARATGQAE